ncbi:MAG: D-alanyl-D-alanine carboxypeptidase, partial [Oscillospiraceae bacterium]|nr:D-alanyl-D-alanine carboxypeptidase [Oscillospiraceae bacterium]
DGKFQLANTNKLIRFYKGANGLKTGSTSKALCCLAATAERDGMQLIAVVLGAPTSKERFGGASTLLDYGFAKYEICSPVKEGEFMASVNVNKGVESSVNAVAKEEFSALLEKGESGSIEKNIIIDESVDAPVKEGDVLGTAEFVRNGNVIGSIELTAEKTVLKKGVRAFISQILRAWFMDTEKPGIAALPE